MSTCGLFRRNGAHDISLGDLGVHRPARRIHIRLRGRVLSTSPQPESLRPACGGETSRVCTSVGVRRPSRGLGLAPAPRAAAPAPCIRRLRRNALSAGYRLLALLAPVGAVRAPRRRVSLSSALNPSPGILINDLPSSANLAVVLALLLTDARRTAEQCLSSKLRGEAASRARRLVERGRRDRCVAFAAERPRGEEEVFRRRSIAGWSASKCGGRSRRASGCETTSPKKWRRPCRRTRPEAPYVACFAAGSGAEPARNSRVAQDCDPKLYMYTASGRMDAQIGCFSRASTVAAKQATR